MWVVRGWGGGGAVGEGHGRARRAVGLRGWWRGGWGGGGGGGGEVWWWWGGGGGGGGGGGCGLQEAGEDGEVLRSLIRTFC